jgi:hypothetical protein
MTFYRHIHPALSREQQEAFVTLGRHLVMLVEDPKWDVAEFDMDRHALDLHTGDDIPPDLVAGHPGPLSCSPLGHAIRAGLQALPGEDWLAYQERVLGASFDSPLEDWLVSIFWRRTDNTPLGAAMRMMYVLDYGVPGDWEAIRDGKAESDYHENGFLWDRLGMMPPNGRR